ncbi:MAG TPA: hypothetical protein VMV06_09350 [Acidimicrobiales bacterium]|nr:hypothetical protein [Acidimicrobiales bacterium]
MNETTQSSQVDVCWWLQSAQSMVKAPGETVDRPRRVVGLGTATGTGTAQLFALNGIEQPPEIGDPVMSSMARHHGWRV